MQTKQTDIGWTGKLIAILVKNPEKSPTPCNGQRTTWRRGRWIVYVLMRSTRNNRSINLRSMKCHIRRNVTALLPMRRKTKRVFCPFVRFLSFLHPMKICWMHFCPDQLINSFLHFRFRGGSEIRTKVCRLQWKHGATAPLRHYDDDQTFVIRPSEFYFAGVDGIKSLVQC